MPGIAAAPTVLISEAGSNDVPITGCPMSADTADKLSLQTPQACESGKGYPIPQEKKRPQLPGLNWEKLSKSFGGKMAVCTKS